MIACTHVNSVHQPLTPRNPRNFSPYLPVLAAGKTPIGLLLLSIPRE
jgi:hypothetical protein